MENTMEKYVDKLLSECVLVEYNDKMHSYIYDAGIPYGYYGLDDGFVREIFSSKYSPRDCIGDEIWEYEAYTKDWLVDELCTRCKRIPELRDIDEDDIKEYLRDNVECYASERYLWEDEVNTHMILQVEDEANHEFTLNTVSDGELLDGSVKWLIEQQGYTVNDFMKLWDGEESELSDNKFLRSLVMELEHVTTYTNKLTILTSTKLENVVDWHEFFSSKLKSDEFITVSKDARIGLVDTWNGAGSLLEIKLEKDLVIPISNIYDVKPDTYYRYSVENVYGVTDKFWEEVEIPVPEVLKEAVRNKM